MRGYRFDLKAFVSDMGGPIACWRALTDMGIPLQPRTVNKWLERGNCDVLYVVNLLAHRALNEGPVDLNRYIVPAREGLVRPRASQAEPVSAAPSPRTSSGSHAA